MQPPSVLRLIKAGSNRWSMADIFLRDDRRAKSNRMEQSLSQQIGVSFLPGCAGIPSDSLPGEDISLGLHPLFQPLRSLAPHAAPVFVPALVVFPCFDVNLGICSGFHYR